MGAPHHRNQGGASGSAAVPPRLSLAGLVHPGLTLLEVVAQRTTLGAVMDARPVWNGRA